MSRGVFLDKQTNSFLNIFCVLVRNALILGKHTTAIAQPGVPKQFSMNLTCLYYAIRRITVTKLHHAIGRTQSAELGVH
jgi:hypothetical protein